VGLRVAALEPRAFRRQAVELGRLHGPAAVAAEVIGAQRVDGHQDDVRTGLAGARRTARAARRDEQQRDERTAAHGAAPYRRAPSRTPRAYQSVRATA